MPGWNPTTGRDASGGLPALSPFGAAMPSQGGPYVPHTGGPGYQFGTVPYYETYPQLTYQSGLAAANPSFYNAYSSPQGWMSQSPYPYLPNGANNAYPRQAQAYPNIDPSMPAAQFTNSSGGVGCEPGYNYFFAPSHAKAHVFRSVQPPWQLPSTAQIQFKAVHIPTSTTLAELLKGFGCTNPVPKKNRCYELINGGGGRWYKGMEINGQEKDMMKKTVKDLGWDETRTGLPGEKPVVCLWFCKN